MGHTARLERARSLRFTDHPDHGHVRAGSGLVRWAGGFVVVQDDVGGVALVEGDKVSLLRVWATDPTSLANESAKALKADFESATVLPDGRLLVFGSGSTHRRTSIVVVTTDLEARRVDGTALYDSLRAVLNGAELNIEGVAVCGRHLVFGQRGNGAGALNALCEVELAVFLAWLEGGPVPVVVSTRVLDLGRVGGVPRGLTDLAVTDEGRLFVLVGAEDSPDTYRDGAILGSWIGQVEGSSVDLVEILDGDTPTHLKLEGLTWLGHEGPQDRFAVVADQDDPEVPVVFAELLV